jgi:hypothetical protein
MSNASLDACARTQHFFSMRISTAEKESQS